MPGTSPVNPNHKLNKLIDQKIVQIKTQEKHEQVPSQLSVNDLLDEQILEQTISEILNNPHQYSPEQTQEIFHQLPLNMEQTKFIVLQLKQRKIIDSGLAGLLCASLHEFTIAMEKNGISEKKKENLQNIINLAKNKFGNLTFNNQLEEKVVGILITMLSFISVYTETINII